LISIFWSWKFLISIFLDFRFRFSEEKLKCTMHQNFFVWIWFFWKCIFLNPIFLVLEIFDSDFLNWKVLIPIFLGVENFPFLFWRKIKMHYTSKFFVFTNSFDIFGNFWFQFFGRKNWGKIKMHNASKFFVSIRNCFSIPVFWNWKFLIPIFLELEIFNFNF